MRPNPLNLAVRFPLGLCMLAALAHAGHQRLAVAFAAITLIHYAVSYDRVVSLLRDGRGTGPHRTIALDGRSRG